jgi:hypothetical protein
MVSCHSGAEARSAPERPARECGSRSAELRIGDQVAHDGRVYVVLGLDPMGVPGRRVDLEDVETGERCRVPLAELEDRGE